MPSTKLAFFRYMLIDRMLRSKQKKYPTKQEILAACQERYGINSLSTVEKDLKAMREEFEAPIKYFKKHQGYAYTESGYRFMSINLSSEEREAMGFVESLLEEFRDLPLFDSFSDAVDKVLDGLEITKKYKQSKHKKIWIDKSPYVKGSELLHNLVSWVSEEQVLALTYQKHQEKEVKAYTLHPYMLKEHANFWYLIGAVEEYEYSIRTFGVDRIQRVAPLLQAFVSPQEISFSPEAYFKNCLGVTIYQDLKPENIRLHFSPTMSNYIIANPIHHSQKTESQDETGTVISLFLITNHELKNVILSYGQHVRVLEPEALRQTIAHELTQSAKLYK